MLNNKFFENISYIGERSIGRERMDSSNSPIFMAMRMMREHDPSHPIAALNLLDGEPMGHKGARVDRNVGHQRSRRDAHRRSRA